MGISCFGGGADYPVALRWTMKRHRFVVTNRITIPVRYLEAVMRTEKQNRVLPHYCTHAAEFFTETAKRLPVEMGIVPDLELFLADYLRDAVKFLLPDNGYLFAEHDYKPAMFELQCLPYPVCALEFSASDELFSPDSGLLQANKRIALCFTPQLLSPLQQQRMGQLLEWPQWLASMPPAALCIMAVYETQSVWAAAIGMAVIDLDKDHPRQHHDADELPLFERVATRLGKRSTKHGLPARFLAFTERARCLGQSEDEAIEGIYIDTIDETRAVYEFLAAINCANVGTQTLPPPRMLNEKRIKKGKVPFFAYQVLDIDPFHGTAGTSTGQAGSHAAPRTHLRRGHLRRLGEKFGHKVLWINATMVNPGSSEVVDKTYQVRPEPSD